MSSYYRKGNHILGYIDRYRDSEHVKHFSALFQGKDNE